MKLHRTLTFFAALTLGSLAAQAGPSQPQAQPQVQPYVTTSASTSTSTLTRAEVIADLKAARQAGTLPRNSHWAHVPAPLSKAGGPRTRAEVRAEAVEAARSGFSVINGED